MADDETPAGIDGLQLPTTIVDRAAVTPSGIVVKGDLAESLRERSGAEARSTA